MTTFLSPKQIKFRISGCCQREWCCHTQKGRES